MVILACTDGSATDSAEAEAPPVVIDDADNYALTLDLAVEPLAIAELADNIVSWGDLTTDIRGDTMSALDVGGIDIWWLQALDPLAVLDAIEGGTLVQGDIALDAFGRAPPDKSSVHLNDLVSFWGKFEPEQYLIGGTGTWLLLLSNDAEEPVSFQLLTPVPGGVGEIGFRNDRPALSMVADLDAGAAAVVPHGATPTFDWAALTVDGRGAPVVADGFDQLTVARFDLDAASLQADFAQLESLAVESWSMSVKGETSAASEGLQNEDGAAFTGITADGTWLLWLGCRSCLSFAPPIVVRLALSGAP